MIVEVPALRIEGTTIPSAEVRATAGATELQTTSNTTGAYAVDLPALDERTTLIVRAHGAGSAAEIELASVVGDMRTLSTRAGADHVLDLGEEHGLLVGPFSTARYAALFWANNSRAPDNRAELEASEDDLDEALTGAESFDVAAAIRLLIDGTGAPLPAGYQTTLELAENIPALWVWLQPQLPAPYSYATIENARLELDSEPAGFVPVADISLSTHFIDLPKKKYGYPGEGGARYELSGDGHGLFQDFASLSVRVLAETSTFTWSIDQDVLHIVCDPPRFGGYPDLNAGDIASRILDPEIQFQVYQHLQMDSVQVLREVLAEDISFIHRGEKIDQVIVRQLSRWHFGDALGQFAPTVDRWETAFGRDLRRASSIELTPFTRTEIVGTWALRLVAPLDIDDYFGFSQGAPHLAAAMVTFREDGTATAIYGVSRAAMELTWMLAADGRLEITFAGGETQTYGKWIELGGFTGNMSWYQSASGKVITNYDRDAKVDPRLVLSEAQLINAANEYWQNTIVLPSYHLPHDATPSYEAIFGYIFSPNEQLMFGLGDIDAMTVSLEDTWSWRIRDGAVEIEQRFDKDRMNRCSYTEPSCIALRRRTWMPVALNGNVLSVIETDTWLKERVPVLQRRYTWDEARGAWVDAMGAALDTDAFGYVVSSRANAYYSGRLP